MSWKKILNILNSLNSSKAGDIDNLSGKFLKDGADILARPISQPFNLSIKLNSLPGSCKIAKVKPLFKKGSKTDPQNYDHRTWYVAFLKDPFWDHFCFCLT